MDNWFIIVLVLASMAGSGLIFLALKKGAQKKHDYQAYAQSQGWLCDADQPAGSGYSSVTAFRDPNDDWTLKVLFQSGGPGNTRVRRLVEWHSPQGALTSGEAVLGMPLPEKSVRMMQMGGDIGKQVLKAALKATFHALGQTRFNLTIDEASAGDPGGVVMASDGQSQAMDALRRNADLARFRDTHQEAYVPIILRDETGLTLRRPGAVKTLEELREIVDLGLSLRSDLA